MNILGEASSYIGLGAVAEHFFNRIKHYRRVATRYDKTVPTYFGVVCLASLMATIL